MPKSVRRMVHRAFGLMRDIISLNRALEDVLLSASLVEQLEVQVTEFANSQSGARTVKSIDLAKVVE